MPGHLLLRDLGALRVHRRLRPHVPDQRGRGRRTQRRRTLGVLRPGLRRARQPRRHLRHGPGARPVPAQGHPVRVRAVRRWHRRIGPGPGGARQDQRPDGEVRRRHLRHGVRTHLSRRLRLLRRQGTQGSTKIGLQQVSTKSNTVVFVCSLLRLIVEPCKKWFGLGQTLVECGIHCRLN